MEFIHYYGGDLGKIKAFRVQQAIEQDLGYDDQYARFGIDLPIAGDEADIVGREPPTYGLFLHLVELLLGERDQRRCVIGNGPAVQRLEQRSVGDERFTGS